MEFGHIRFKDSGPENNHIYSYVLTVICIFSNFVWTNLLIKNNTQTLKDSFEKNLIFSKRKSNLIETDRGKKIL